MSVIYTQIAYCVELDQNTALIKEASILARCVKRACVNPPTVRSTQSVLWRCLVSQTDLLMLFLTLYDALIHKY